MILNTQVIPSLMKFLQYITQEYQTRDSISIYDVPNGESYYKHLKNFYTETPLTFDVIYSLGESLVANKTLEMTQFLKDNSINSTLQDFIENIRNDTSFYYENEEEYLLHISALAKNIEPKLVHLITKTPKCPYGIEILKSMKGISSVFESFNAPNYQCHSAGMLNFNTFSLQNPSYHHEALLLKNIFGTYLQTAFSTEMDPTYPIFRNFVNFPSFEDGWSLYALSMGEKLGLFKEKYQKFGKLSLEMLSACKIVIDIGIHYKKWSRQQAIDYLKKTALSQFEIENQVDFCIANPGRCLSEKFGEIRISELKKKVEKASKEKHMKFNLKEFHYQALKYGIMPLLSLDDKIDDYIDSLGKSESPNHH